MWGQPIRAGRVRRAPQATGAASRRFGMGPGRFLAAGWPLLALAGAGGAVVWAVWKGLAPDGWPVWAPPTVAAAGAVAALLSLIELLRLASWRAVLEADAIRVRRLGAERRLTRSQIAGVRRGRSAGEPQLLLEPRDTKAAVLGVSELEAEPAFARWLEGVPDLDRLAGDRRVAAALSDPVLGEVADERQANLVRQGKANRWLAAGALLLTLWGLAWPRPEALCIAALAAALPVLAMGAVVWRLQGWRWRFEGEVSGGLALAAIGPAAALAFRAFSDIELVWPWTPLPWAIGAAVAAALVTAATMLPMRLRRRRRLAPVALAMTAAFTAMTCWAWGAMIFENAWGPGQAAEEHVPVAVIGYDEAGEANGPTLSLAPWQALATPADARRLGLASRPAQPRTPVEQGVYDAAARGEAVCAHLTQGARGWPMVEYRPCPPKRPWHR